MYEGRRGTKLPEVIALIDGCLDEEDDVLLSSSSTNDPDDDI